MMLALMVAASALAGCGLVLIVRGTVGSTTPLATVVAELHRPRQLATVRQSWLEQSLERVAGPAARRRQTDLAICERSVGKFVQDRFVWAVLGAAPALTGLALSSTGTLSSVPAGLLAAATVAGGVAGWFYALIDLRSDAKRKRREFRHALAGYLELVTILMAGGAGVETALYDGASIGRGPAFRHLRTALSAAQARREAPWATLGVLGKRLGVYDLIELEASMTLAGGGARVRDSLIAKAEAMRNRDLNQLESEAQARSETMVLPVAMMFAGFLILIGYPALAGLSGP